MPEQLNDIETITPDTVEEYVPGPVEDFVIQYLKEALGINEE